MRNDKFSDEEKDYFIELVQELGIGPALRKSTGRKPSDTTIRKWFKERGLEVPYIDSVARKAAEMKHFYSDQEKKYATQTLIDRIVEKLDEDDLRADEINKLSNALETAIKTMNLIEGKSTQITETQTKDGTDLAAIDMINSLKARNALAESELS